MQARTPDDLDRALLRVHGAADRLIGAAKHRPDYAGEADRRARIEAANCELALAVSEVCSILTPLQAAR